MKDYEVNEVLETEETENEVSEEVRTEESYEDDVCSTNDVMKGVVEAVLGLGAIAAAGIAAKKAHDKKKGKHKIPFKQKREDYKALKAHWKELESAEEIETEEIETEAVEVEVTEE